MSEAPKRRFILKDKIDEDSVTPIMMGILEVNEYDDDQEKKLVKYTRAPIELIVNSPGGNVTDGFALISIMEQSTTPIHTYGYGRIASMALAVYAAGDKRYTDLTTSFMYHGCVYGTWGNIPDHEVRLDWAKNTQKLYDEYLLSRTEFQKSLLDDVKEKKRDMYFFGEDAIEYGLAHELIKRKTEVKA